MDWSDRYAKNLLTLLLKVSEKGGAHNLLRRRGERNTHSRKIFLACCAQKNANHLKIYWAQLSKLKQRIEKSVIDHNLTRIITLFVYANIAESPFETPPNPWF